GDDSVAMFNAWFTCLVSFSPRNLLLITPGRFVQPLELTRTPQPALSFLLLLGAMWLLSRAMTQPTAARIVLGGLSAGLLFHAYYFYWVAFFGGVSCLFAILALSRKWDLAKAVGAVLAIGFVAGLPIFIWTFQTTRGGYAHDLM